jgi:glycosyltransferase involved in cell wall biosynthesis
MKISIITISFNSEKTIEATIKSVLLQEGVELEYIIIDGASTDRTLEKIQPFKSKIHHLISEPDQGIYDAMNKGIRMATGEVIGILNSDDTYADPNVLADVMKQIEDKDAVYGDLEYVNGETGKTIRKWKSGLYQEGAFLFGWMPPHPTFFVRSAVYKKWGVFRTDHGTAADYEIMLRFIHKHRIAMNYLPRILVRMKTGGASNDSWKKRWQANRLDKKSWQLNEIRPKWYTLWLKPLRKVSQWF